MKTALKRSRIGLLLLALGLLLPAPLPAGQTVDGDGNITIQPDGQPAQGILGQETQAIVFQTQKAAVYTVKNAEMWSAPTIMVLYDSEGTELGRNIKDDDVAGFVEADLKQDQIYFLILAAIKDEDHGKAFSISVKAEASQSDPSRFIEDVGPELPADKRTAESLIGPVRLPSGVEVGQDGVSYIVQRNDQGHISRLDDDQGDGFLIEYRRSDEQPGLDVWRKDGTYTRYDFHETHNQVSQGRFGQAPDTVMTLDRETGEQITRTQDGTVVTTSPAQDGQMTVTTKIPGRPSIQSRMSTSGQMIQGPSRVVTDAQGRPTEVYLAGRKMTATRYDTQGRPVEITLDGGATVRNRYDSQGQLTETVDAYGDKTRYAYDQAQRQVITTLPDGATVTEVQDPEGRCLELTGPGGNKTVTHYADSVATDVNLVGLDEQGYAPFDEGRFSIARSSLTGTWIFEKDGHSIQRTDPLKQSVVFTYNPQAQLQSIQDAQGTALVTLTYDNANLIKAQTPEYTVTIAYDNSGRIASEQVSPADITLSYVYDSTGMLQALHDSQGHKVTYNLDENGQLAGLTDSQAGQFKLTYGPFALPAKLERPNGVKTEWQYDAGGRLLSCVHVLPQETLSAKYSYDARGQLKGIMRDPGDDTTYTYDAAGHWTQIDEWNKSQPMQYDPWGQILLHNKIQYHYNTAGHVNQISMKGDELKLGLTCDAAGRLTRAEIPGSEVLYRYDWDHRLIACEAPNVKNHYRWTYDALGRVAASEVAEDETVTQRQYLYSLGQLYGVLEAKSGLDRYIHIPGTKHCVAVIKADGRVLYPLWDHTDSIFALTDADGSISGSRSYWSIGGTMHEENMPIALGYRAALVFVADTVAFINGQAQLMAFHRAAAAPAPWPHQSSLRTHSPFIALANQRTR